MTARFFRLALLAGFGWLSVCAPGRAADERIASITGAILEADGPQAIRLLTALPEAQLDEKDKAFRACALHRLSSPPMEETVRSPVTETPDGFATNVLELYRVYWRAAVMDPKQRSMAETALRYDLARLLRVAPATPMDKLEQEVDARLRRSGFHSLEGRTGLLREFMLWSKQEIKTYSVQLPEGMNETNVVFMDHFISRGWSSYLTCDRTGTGGWTKPDGLYVVVPAYDSFTDETFRVNFLAHESQHYFDHKHFPNLAAWELEYRAKLVELAYANETMRQTLLRFASDQGDDPGSPHSYADKRVLIAVRNRLGLAPGDRLEDVSVARIHGAAIAELRADSARRRSGVK